MEEGSSPRPPLDRCQIVEAVRFTRRLVDGLGSPREGFENSSSTGTTAPRLAQWTVGKSVSLLTLCGLLFTARRLDRVTSVDDLSDWVPERSMTAKTWYANDVFLPVWRSVIQLINIMLLGKQKPLEVTGAFLYILKNKIGHADEDEDLDWTTYFKEKIRKEIRTCKKQMQASGKSGPPS
ncbi:hypothetical protein R1sor_003824 [Riccia sorocarpa]|uniref:Uncharacterized protein n=1 Tax=Riccia sorocarpa TaxID=122646 RepID=A0ABD3H2R1_9MARC